MVKRQIFYSFHYDNDVFRVQQIRNIGSLEENTPVTLNKWETIKQGGESSVKNWIDDNLKGKSCVVVLIGSETSNRKWVKYEIEKAWNDGRAVIGIYIHNLRCPKNGTSLKGKNPFDEFNLSNGQKLSSTVKCYNPNTYDAYNDIKKNLEKWVEQSILSKQ